MVTQPHELEKKMVKRRINVYLEAGDLLKADKISKLIGKSRSKVLSLGLEKMLDPINFHKERRKKHMAKANWHHEQQKLLEEQKR